VKGGSAYDVYAFHPLTTPLTSTSWDGDAYSTTAKTLIDLSAVFGVPAGVKAIYARTAIRDSGSPADLALILGPTNAASVGMYNRCNATPADAWSDANVIVSCNADGDIYYQIVASDAGTMDIYIQIWGYWL